MRYLPVLSFLPLVCCAVLLGQQQTTKSPLPVAPKNDAADQKAADYSGEALVFERIDVTYKYAADGTGERRLHTVVRVQSEAAVKQLSIVHIAFAGRSQKPVAELVQVIRPDGTTVKTDPADAIEMPLAVTQQAPFYSDLKDMQIPVRQLRVGDRLECDLRIVFEKPEAPGEFWGAENESRGAVVLEQSLELRVPKGKYVQVWSPKLKAETADAANGEKVYRWTSSQLKPTPKEAEVPEGDPELKQPDVMWTTFKSWADVGAWYRTLTAGRADVTPTIKKHADEVVVGKSTQEEKAKALYADVALHIRYIGVAFGIGRYQPHRADDVLANQYGDCKDKHTLLQAMLKAEGIDSEPVLIGAGINMNEEVPSPASFNHLITLATVDGKPTWLDSTAEVAPYRMLLFPLRDKQALPIPATGQAALLKTPAEAPVPSYERFVAKGAIDKDGLMKSEMELSISGDSEVVFRAAWRQIAPTKVDEVMQSVSSSIGFGGTASHVETSKVEDIGEPFVIRYHYEKPEYGNWSGRQITPLFPVVNFPSVDEKKPPKSPIQLGPLQTFEAVTRIKLPDGVTAQLPEAVKADSPYASYVKSYHMEGNEIVVERKIATKVQKIPAEEWKKYQAFYKASIGKDEPWIQLIGLGGNVTADSNPAARAILDEVAQANLQKDWVKARQKLEEAKSINPKEPYLHSWIGFVAGREGNMDEAVKNYKIELASYPKEEDAYRLLIEAELWHHNRKAAEEDLREELKVLPDNRAAATQLSQLLVGDGDDAGAVEILKASGRGREMDEMQQAYLAESLLRLGKTDEAAAILKPILDGGKNIVAVNNVAYAVSNSKMLLPEAEAAEKRVLADLEKASADDDARTSGKEALVRSNNLVADWDTLGWIYFQAGKTVEAESYLHAAWMNSRDAENALHMGQLLEKQGKPGEALRVYELGEGGRQATAPAVKKALKDAQERLRKETHQSASTTSAIEDLQKARTFSINDKSDLSGWATAQMKVGPDGVEEVALIEGEQKLSVLSDKIRALKMGIETPKESAGRLIRKGVVSCKESGCEIVLIPM